MSSMNHGKKSAPSYDYYISGSFYLSALIFLGTLVLAVVFYGETFLFWHHAFSDLGNTVTRGGDSNLRARMIYSTGVIIDSSIMLGISAYYGKNPKFRNRSIKQWLAILGAIGFVISIYPNNINHTFHSVGAGMIIGVLYFFIMIFHFELNSEILRSIFYSDLVILHLAVFSYAVAFFVESAYKQILQKCCIFGIFYTLQRIVTITEESFHPVEILGFFKRFQH